MITINTLSPFSLQSSTTLVQILNALKHLIQQQQQFIMRKDKLTEMLGNDLFEALLGMHIHVYYSHTSCEEPRELINLLINSSYILEMFSSHNAK